MTTRGWWCIAALGFSVAASQAASARWLVRDFETPNASTQTARTLVSTGRYSSVGGERLWGPYSLSADQPLRFFVLPGEPLLLAAAFAVVPEPLHRFIHVPVTVLLIVSVALFAAVFGGPRLACTTMLVAAVQPFVLMHGPVWDDTFLAAALAWSSLAILASRLSARPPSPSRTSIALVLAGALAVGVAVVTRGDTVLFVALLFGTTMVSPTLRRLRKTMLLYGAAASLAVAAWGLRNERVVGSFEIGSSHDGITLWESNGPYTMEALRRGQVMMLSADLDRMAPYWRETQDLDEVAANRFFARRAIEYVRMHPLASLKLSARKAAYTMGAIRPEIPMASRRNLVGLAASAITVVLATLGAISILRAQSRTRMVAAALLVAPLAATNAVVMLIGPIGARYRIALDGVLWILAAHALVATADAILARNASTGATMPSADRSHV